MNPWLRRLLTAARLCGSQSTAAYYWVGRIVAVSWRELIEAAATLSRGLRELGVGPTQRVLFGGSPTYEARLFDAAVGMAGACTACLECCSAPEIASFSSLLQYACDRHIRWVAWFPAEGHPSLHDTRVGEPRVYSFDDLYVSGRCREQADLADGLAGQLLAELRAFEVRVAQAARLADQVQLLGVCRELEEQLRAQPRPVGPYYPDVADHALPRYVFTGLGNAGLEWEHQLYFGDFGENPVRVFGPHQEPEAPRQAVLPGTPWSAAVGGSFINPLFGGGAALYCSSVEAALPSLKQWEASLLLGTPGEITTYLQCVEEDMTVRRPVLPGPKERYEMLKRTVQRLQLSYTWRVATGGLRVIAVVGLTAEELPLAAIQGLIPRGQAEVFPVIIPWRQSE